MSTSNPLVKLIRSLRQHKGRDESGLFLVEGIHHVGEASEAGWDLQTLVYSPELLTSEYGLQLVESVSHRGVRLAAFSRELFAGLADKENPQGILAVVAQKHLALKELTGEAIPWGAACVSPQDPGNVGTILRTLDAVGAGGLFMLDGGVDLYHPSVVRASMGTLFWKPVIQASFKEFVLWAHEHEFLLVGSSAHAAMDYRDFRRENRKVILLLGSEQKGLSAEQQTACDLHLSMPMLGRASSLNLAVAAGVLLYRMME